MPQMLVALALTLGKPMEIFLAGPLDSSHLAAIRRRFLPNAVVGRADEAPVAMAAINGKATVYVCSNFACNLPVTEVNQLDELLE